MLDFATLLNISSHLGTSLTSLEIVVRLFITLSVFYFIALRAVSEKKANLAKVILFLFLTVLSFTYGVFVKPFALSLVFSYGVFFLYTLMKLDKSIIRRGELSFLFLSVLTSVINADNVLYLEYSSIVLIDLIIIISVILIDKTKIKFEPVLNRIIGRKN